MRRVGFKDTAYWKHRPFKVTTYWDHRPFQVAVSNDKDLEYRKWDHRGTCWIARHFDAAIKFGVGRFVKEHSGSRHGVIFQFEGNFVHVGFGWIAAEQDDAAFVEWVACKEVGAHCV